ncbi:kinase-like protein [Rhizophagus irregularis]|uniref:Kinase-like protein n=1 Tax=Rhizophagus irregularis TaxID=588596 RepID=A0A2I1EVZ0_9GLOM|nr:kinase-like protein [Rhizophagus irregularis]PKC62401.1 kinase-like protein [Rhizophagus irregularis]PKY26283.1 kinase-like protein [Rhizophagus irregularis]
MSKQEEIDDDKSSESSRNSVEMEYNLEGLKKIASKVFGKSCISVNKLGEGGFHKVFILKMEDDSEYIGKIAFPECPYWKTESEVAVMKYIKERTSIKVPEVYHYDSSKENLVGQEYIIMEKLPGIALSKAWDNYDINQKKEVLLQVIEIQSIDKEIVYSKKYFNEEEQEKWIPIYEEFLSFLPKYFKNNNDIFVLTHGDFYHTNIIVDGTKITGIVDWECSGSYPIECSCNYPCWILENPDDHLLKDFWTEEMRNRDPEFIRIMYDMYDTNGSKGGHDREQQTKMLMELLQVFFCLPNEFFADLYDYLKCQSYLENSSDIKIRELLSRGSVFD